MGWFNKKRIDEEDFDWSPYLGKTVIFKYCSVDWEGWRYFGSAEIQEGTVDDFLGLTVKIRGKWMDTYRVRFMGTPIRALHEGL